jgi:hypothetical protein
VHISGCDEEHRNWPCLTTAVLFDSLVIKATEKGLSDRCIRLPIKKFVEMRGAKQAVDTRIIKRDLDALSRVGFEFKGKRHLEPLIYLTDGEPCQIENRDIVFRFSQQFFDSFKSGKKGQLLYMPLPQEALTGNLRKHPHKYCLMRKISELKRMNLCKPNEDIIRVNTLLAVCPALPTYEEVLASNHSFNERIKEPFERDMKELQSVISWKYKGGREPADFKEFLESTITIEWHKYPTTNKFRERKTAWEQDRQKKQRQDAG